MRQFAGSQCLVEMPVKNKEDHEDTKKPYERSGPFLVAFRCGR